MKRFIFYALDQYTLKVYRRQEWEAGVKHGIKCEQQRTIELLESGKHVFQLDIAPNGKWKQRCRCGFYGIFNDHLIALIKGEK
jgi:hypothetical protein